MHFEKWIELYRLVVVRAILGDALPFHACSMAALTLVHLESNGNWDFCVQHNKRIGTKLDLDRARNEDFRLEQCDTNWWRTNMTSMAGVSQDAAGGFNGNTNLIQTPADAPFRWLRCYRHRGLSSTMIHSIVMNAGRATTIIRSIGRWTGQPWGISGKS